MLERRGLVTKQTIEQAKVAVEELCEGLMFPHEDRFPSFQDDNRRGRPPAKAQKTRAHLNTPAQMC